MHQARAPQAQPFGPEAYQPQEQTVLRWLGMAGFLINSRGATVMIDPLLGGFDMPLMIDYPTTTEAVPRLDAVLVTHSDTRSVDMLMRAEGFPSAGHDIGDRFAVGDLRVGVTPADHAWQNETPGAADRVSSRRTAAGSGSILRTAPSGRRVTPG